MTHRSPRGSPRKQGTGRDVSEVHRCRESGPDTCRGIPAPGIAEGAEAQPTIARPTIPVWTRMETRFQPLPRRKERKTGAGDERGQKSNRSLRTTRRWRPPGRWQRTLPFAGRFRTLHPLWIPGDRALREPFAMIAAGTPCKRSNPVVQAIANDCRSIRSPGGDVKSRGHSRSLPARPAPFWGHVREMGKTGESGKATAERPAKSMQSDVRPRPIQAWGPAASRADAAWPCCPGVPLPCTAPHEPCDRQSSASPG